nr:hypothetical protein [Actinomycetota bacterium]
VSDSPFVVLTTAAAVRSSPGAEALEQVTGSNKPIRAVIEMLRPSGLEELRRLCQGTRRS